MTPDYSNYESLDSFGPGQLGPYREMLLRKTKHQTDFILKHVGTSHMDVLELCCGNGRLLLSLATEGVLNYGYGVDFSQSRIKFAKKWIREIEKGDWVIVETGNVTKMGGVGNFDLAVCITGAVQYFDNGDRSHILQLMLDATFALPGKALFELYKPPTRLGTSWYELPPEDPWQYCLSQYESVEGDNVLQHEKIFVSRTGKIDKRVEVLHYYTMDEFLGLLKEVGFNKVYWAKENSTTMVILAGV